MTETTQDRGQWRGILLPAAIEILVNFILPYAIFVATDAAWGDVGALLAASLPPVLWSGIEFARRRRLDAISLLVVAGIAISLLAFIGGGSARLLQLRENLVSALIGLVFLGSAAIGRPLIYQLARAGMSRRSATEAQHFESLKDNPGFRRTMTLMTLVWGFGALAIAIVSSALVFMMPIATYLLVSPVVAYGALGLMALWTFWYAKRARARGEAMRAAAGTGAPGK